MDSSHNALPFYLCRLTQAICSLIDMQYGFSEITSWHGRSVFMCLVSSKFWHASIEQFWGVSRTDSVSDTGLQGTLVHMMFFCLI